MGRRRREAWLFVGLVWVEEVDGRGWKRRGDGGIRPRRSGKRKWRGGVDEWDEEGDGRGERRDGEKERERERERERKRKMMEGTERKRDRPF